MGTAAAVPVEAQRITELNGAPEGCGAYVLYWMQQSQRAAFNPALELAIASANRLQLPVLVVFGLTDDFPGANARHYSFMLQGLAETARQLRQRRIGFVIRRGKPDAVALELASQAALIVCDHGYLRVQRQWRARLAATAKVRVVCVEGDVVVPVALASRQRELGARTLRPKLARWRDTFLKPLRRVPVRFGAQNLTVQSTVDLEDVPRVLAALNIERGIAPVSAFKGGHAEAQRLLAQFIAEPLSEYVAARARPGLARVSRLSPYLHFGQISPVEVALAVRAAPVAAEDRDSYLEELIVRRELAANFVATTAEYDRYECLPAWAQRTLEQHARDERPHLYDYRQLSSAQTHDPYWNAAMREMLATGFMHNYMRMYWGKKVLEWSASPREGYEVLLRLNNSYFLDGRDPSSFANVAWVFGLHDRPWPERVIFGNVRYMNAAGLQRKTDVERYVSIWGGGQSATLPLAF